jgi:two-component system LytT family sensor kinase
MILIGMTVVVLAVICAALLAGHLVLLLRRRPVGLGTAADRATFDTLHTAGQAARGLREGLTASGAERAIKHLRPLLGASAVALTDLETTLAVDGHGHSHEVDAYAHGSAALAAGRTMVLSPAEMGCPPGCPIRAAVVAPLRTGTLIAYARQPSAILVRATGEVAAWIGEQLELGEAEQHGRMLAEAELRALRAQISPHFIYNSLNAVATFVRTDPERARELLLEFADFTRYAFRRGGDFATLSDELRNTERYLVLEQARFGERLRVSLRVAPEVLPISVPYLVVQPLVENAVRHGLDADRETMTVSIVAADEGATALLTVEDDGAGADPEVIRAALVGGPAQSGIGLGLSNVDSRLRQVFGDKHGLVVETAPGAGTKVTLRIPKFAPGTPRPGAG